MPAPIDMTGLVFGRLTALALEPGSGVRRWRFACACGNEKVLSGAMVRSGNTRSCGCFRKETTGASRAVDLLGVRFCRLVVLNKTTGRDKNGAVQWLCQCDCGAKTVGITRVLKAGLKQSCGCLRREKTRALGKSSKKQNPISKTPEYRKAIRRKRRADPTVAMSERVSRLLALALASVGAIKRSATFNLLGYTPAALKAHIERQFLAGMSWANRDAWEVDHITPISTATCEEDVIALNQLSNLRPLWSTHNNKKKDKRLFLL